MGIELLFEYIGTHVNSHLLLAAGLGALIGLERELAGKDPSIRTFTLISTGSCIFSMISIEAAAGIANAEPSRIAAQVVSGVGFLGAGTIFRARNRVVGLTTAALMWVTASIGMAVGFNCIDIAISGTLISLLATIGLRTVHRLTAALRKQQVEQQSNGVRASNVE